ncbi:MAG: hypothetical protein IIV74_00170 [Alphaproteobacteria bacterium]|nr:hypothetical protein [Alphaproteobacteria bacterium]
MIDKNAVFDFIGVNAAVWCGADMDATDLAKSVQFVNEKKLSMISVAPNVVQTVWPWLEAGNVKIMSRFYMEKINEGQISDVTVRINSVLRQGAHGAQIFLPYRVLAELVEQTHVVRDDLFFNKDLAIGMDIDDVGPFDWDDVFANLRKINASSVIFVLTKDSGDKSDFVGRLYGMLNAWGMDNKFNLHFAFGPNFMRIEQAQRLVQQVRPMLMDGLRFWINF